MICTPRPYLCQGSVTGFCRGKPKRSTQTPAVVSISSTSAPVARRGAAPEGGAERSAETISEWLCGVNQPKTPLFQPIADDAARGGGLVPSPLAGEGWMRGLQVTARIASEVRNYPVPSGDKRDGSRPSQDDRWVPLPSISSGPGWPGTPGCPSSLASARGPSPSRPSSSSSRRWPCRPCA